MKKSIAIILAVLTLISAFVLTFPTTALADGEKVYEKATDEVIDKYLKEADDLKNVIINSKTNVEWTGTAYYISANGSDSNDGLTPETAWKSTAKIKDGKMLKAGDAVLFERGSSFRLADSIQTKRGVTYSSYGSGAKPLLIGSIDASSRGSWSLTETENVYKYKAPVDQDVGVIVFNMGEATGIKMISLLDNGEVHNGYESFKSGGQLIDGPEDLKNDLEYWHDPETKEVYLLSKSGSPFERFVSIELVDYGHAMRGEGHDVLIDNIAFFGFGSHCIGYGSATGLKVQYCTFNFIGGSIQGDMKTSSTRYGNAIEIYGVSNGYVIDHCFAANVFDCCWTIQVGDGDNSFKNVEFSNNVAMYSNSGPEVWIGKSTDSAKEHVMENVRVHDNYTLYSGYGWSNQRPAHKKDANILYGGTSISDVKYKNVSFDNNVGICPYYFIYFARYISSVNGFNLNNNTYIQHNTRSIGGLAEEPIMGTGGIGNHIPYTEENVMKYVDMGLDPGSKFYYVEDDFVVPRYDPDIMKFDDITEKHWAYNNVKTAVMRNWFNGTSPVTFEPNTGMTRAMLVTVLSRIDSVDAPAKEVPYKDVAAKAWYYPTVKWAYNAGIIEGADSFRPNDPITREELADMLYKYTLKQYKAKAISSPKLDFTDASSVTPAYAAGVAYAIENGIIKGYDDGTVRPKNGATRAEVATMTKRFADFYFDLEADYSNITSKTDSHVFSAEELVKIVPNAPTLINKEINPTLHFPAENTRAYNKQLSFFERFLKVNLADYPYIKIRYTTNIKADRVQIGITKSGKEATGMVDIKTGETTNMIFSYYDIMKPDGSVDMTQQNGSLYIKPWASFGEWSSDENSYFDIEYIACFPTYEAAEAYSSDFEANSVLLTFMNGNDPYASVAIRKGDKFTNSLVPEIEKHAYNFKGWSIAEGTVINENMTVNAVFEKILGEPIALFTPENTKATASGGLEVSTVSENGITYFHYSVPTDSSSKDNTRAIVDPVGDYDVSINKVMKVGYREKIASADHTELNFTFGTRRLWTHYEKYGEEGKWNELTIDLSAVKYTGGQNVQSGLSAGEYFEYFVKGNMSPMFKPFQNNGNAMVTSDYFDIAYIAFFDSIEDAKAFDGFAAIKK